jgi:transcriptional regulator with PAS, ATPase and Fis domain
MDRSTFRNQSAGRPSDALAIFEEGFMVYANKSFEKLYKSLKNTVRERFDTDLHELNLDLQKSGKAFAQKHLTLIPQDMEIDVHVYLLNKFGSEKNGLLVLANPGNPQTESLSFITEHEQLLDPNQILKKGSQMKLLPAFSELVGEDPHFKAVLFKAQKAARSDYPVLIEGESGTGKEILARTIHQTSHRNRKKFVDINCAAIPDQLIDSELFGYEKGAFTGATPGGRHGLFVEAHQGTLFFDEIADASLQTKAKLLRVLNEGCFKRIGSTKNIEVDVRIISATNKDLSRRIKERRFREDLIYRLNTISIYLPPLRDRPMDILLLAKFFLKKHSKKQHRNLQFSAKCLDFLKLYHWPGNVRELKGVVDYMATMASGSLITENYFPDFLLPAEHRSGDHSKRNPHHFKADQDHVLLSTAVEHTEKEVIKEVLLKARTRSEAIKILGISRRTFYTKLKQYNLT